MKRLVFLGMLAPISMFSVPATATVNPCGEWSSCVSGGKATVGFKLPGQAGSGQVSAPGRVAHTPPSRPVVAPTTHVSQRPKNSGSSSGVPNRGPASSSAGPSVADELGQQAAAMCSAGASSACTALTAAHAAMTVPPSGRAVTVPDKQTAVTPAPPQVTPAQAAAQAWTTQPFAAAHVTMQPVGNETLTGLPTYFQATFPGAGLAPGQQVSATVLGQSVTIRPASAEYTYDLGDGTTQGPTSDAGGTYPNGHITHTYEKPGKVTVRIDVTLTGEYQVAGGGWQPIPGSTTVRGVPQQLTVDIMQSRLDSDDGGNTTP